MKLKEQIKQHKFQMYLNEISNDTYYLSNQYKEDKETLYQLEKKQNLTKKYKINRNIFLPNG